MGNLGSIPGLGISPGEREWVPTPVFWPGEFQGLYSPWGRKELDTAEWLTLSFSPSLESYDKPRWWIEYITLLTCPSSQSYSFSSSHVWMWASDHKKGWVPKNWCLHTEVLVKTLESPMDNKEIKPVNPKGNQPWLFIERTDAEAETPILWAELTHWKRPWCWERLKAKGEEGSRGWDG